jgi:hypothetical protein
MGDQDVEAIDAAFHAIADLQRAALALPTSQLENGWSLQLLDRPTQGRQ